MRGLLEVAVMMPKDAPELTVLLGLAKFGVLVRLKNSPRMRRLWDSTMGMLRSSAMSRLCWPGPRTRPTPLFPKSVSAELVPLGTSGAEVRRAGCGDAQAAQLGSILEGIVAVNGVGIVIQDGDGRSRLRDEDPRSLPSANDMPHEHGHGGECGGGVGEAENAAVRTIEIGEAVVAARIALIVGEQPQLEDLAAGRATGFVEVARECIATEELQAAAQTLCDAALQRVVVGIVGARAAVGTGSDALVRSALDNVGDGVACRAIDGRGGTGEKRLIKFAATGNVNRACTDVTDFGEIVVRELDLRVQVVFLSVGFGEVRGHADNRRATARNARNEDREAGWAGK